MRRFARPSAVSLLGMLISTASAAANLHVVGDA
jgi:hypothetical protein